MALYQPEFIALVGFHWGDFVPSAGRKWNAPTLQEAPCCNQHPQQTTTHAKVVSTLTHLRQEWQEATVGASLLETNGNIGLMLADVINGLGLERRINSRFLETICSEN